MSKDKKMSNVQSWNYAGEADLMLGEVHQSKVAKITLICVLVTLASALFLIVMNWAMFYDYIANPSILLTTDSVNLEVGSNFDPNAYIIPQSLEDMQNGVYAYEITGADKVITTPEGIKELYPNLQINAENKILATYEVHYISQNKARTTDRVLTVNIVDTVAPVIKLTQDSAFLVQGVQTGEYFNAQDYVESITDAFTVDEKIQKTVAEGNWNTQLNPQTGIGQLEVIYTATDEAGNTSTVTLTVYIFENEELRDKFEQEKAEEAVAAGLATPTPTPSPTPTPTPEPTSPPETEPPETEAPSNSGGGGGGQTYEPENTSPVTNSFKANDITYSLSQGLDALPAAVANSVVDYGGSGWCQPQFPNEQAVPGGSWTIYWVDSAGVQVGTSHIYFTE